MKEEDEEKKEQNKTNSTSTLRLVMVKHCSFSPDIQTAQPFTVVSALVYFVETRNDLALTGH